MAAVTVFEPPTPVHTIHHERFLEGTGWSVHDISLCSSGKIAISGGHYEGEKSVVCVYSTDIHSDCDDKPELVYFKDFKDKFHVWRRCISFMKPTSTLIITFVGGEIKVLDYKQDAVLQSREVNDTARCLSVNESQIFIGFMRSTVRIYDYNLEEIRHITLRGIQVWPLDIAAAAGQLYVCTALGEERAVVCSLNSGDILREYTAEQDPRKAWSIAVNLKFEVTAVLLHQDTTDQKQVVFFVPSDDQPFLTIDVKTSVSRIRISDRGRIITGSFTKGDVNSYDLALIFTFGRLKNFLVSRLKRDDCEKIMGFFLTERKEMKTLVESNTPGETLLHALEEKNVIQPSSVRQLGDACLQLKLNPLFYHVLRIYQAFMEKSHHEQRELPPLQSFRQHHHEMHPKLQQQVQQQGQQKVAEQIPQLERQQKHAPQQQPFSHYEQSDYNHGQYQQSVGYTQPAGYEQLKALFSQMSPIPQVFRRQQQASGGVPVHMQQQEEALPYQQRNQQVFPSSEGGASGHQFQEHRAKLKADSEHPKIKYLSSKLTSEWKDVCRSLGVEEGTIYRNEENHKGNIKEAIYQSLLSCKQENGDRAFFESLRRALVDNKRSDLAKDIEE